MAGNLCPKEIQVIWQGLLKGDATISTSNEWQNMEQAAAGDQPIPSVTFRGSSSKSPLMDSPLAFVVSR